MSEEVISEQMLKSSDPAFKLFGRTIPVVSASEASERSSDSTDASEVTKIKSDSSDDINTKSSFFLDNMSHKKIKTTFNDEKSKSIIFVHKNEEGRSGFGDENIGLSNNTKEKNFDIEVSHEKLSVRDEKDQKSNMGEEGSGNVICGAEVSEESNKSEDEMPKKPNRRLPCPRCESMDTKFCYYNNYNVNQPRHFCRNCQRYWTAGGLLRNVPVGAGRRKNKHSAAMAHQRNLVSEGQAVRGHASDCNSEESMKFEVCDLEMTSLFDDVNNGVTKHLGAYVGQDSPGLLSQENENFQKPNQMKAETFWNNSCLSEWGSHDRGGEPGKFRALDDSVCTSSKTKVVKSEMESFESSNTTNNSVSWVSGPPPVWPMYCGSFFGNSPPMNGMGRAMMNPEALQASAMMPWFQPGFLWPFPFGPMWGQASWGTTWGMPLRPVGLDSSPSTLGKHTRDLSTPESEPKGDGSIWVPKTLRIDDPEEAAKSSIWATLGLGSKPESITSGGIFKAFQPKTENKDDTNTKTSVHVLCANPAATTRSASFNESV